MNADFEKFVRKFLAEQSDQAFILIGAAKLDYVLGEVLRKSLYPNTSGSDDLFDSNGPLSTFSAKINFCYRLGFIDAEFSQSLHLLRRIRNSFAHESSGCSLSSGAHRDRARALTSRFSEMKDFNSIVKKIKEKLDGKSDDEVISFKLTVAWMCLSAEKILFDAKAIYRKPTWHVVEDWTRDLHTKDPNEG